MHVTGYIVKDLKKIHQVVVGSGGVHFLISPFLCFTSL